MAEKEVVKMVHGLPTVLVPDFPAHEQRNLASGGSGTGRIDVWGVCKGYVPVKFTTRIKITRTSLLKCTYAIDEHEYDGLAEALESFDKFATVSLATLEKMPAEVLRVAAREIELQHRAQERQIVSQLEDVRREMIETSKGVKEAVARMIEYRTALTDIGVKVSACKHNKPEDGLKELDRYITARIEEVEGEKESI